MKKELIKLLSRNARYTNEQLAVMLGSSEEAVEAEIKRLEKEGIICGYKAIVDHSKLDDNSVSAIVELNVVPKANLGFDEVAERIAAYEEVENVYLTSGVYDLHVVVKGKRVEDIARFVARELATIDSVTSTATHFLMKRYKEKGVILADVCEDDRRQFSI